MGADQMFKQLRPRTALKNVPRAKRNACIVVRLTCLQFGFTLLATFLLFSGLFPAVYLLVGRNLSQLSQLLRQWNSFRSHILRRVQPFETPEPPVCGFENVDLVASNYVLPADEKSLHLRREFYIEIMQFQQQTRGCETLEELMALPSIWNTAGRRPKVTVVLNHVKRRRLCAQLDALLKQALPIHKVWILVMTGSPEEDSLKRIVAQFNDSRISFSASSHQFTYLYGTFGTILQADDADYFYILNNDMVPGRKLLRILSHTAGTNKYRNAVLGSSGRILPFRQKDFSFPSYMNTGVKEAGLSMPDPAYDILVDRITQVDILSSSWFLSTELVKLLLTEASTFTSGSDEDLRLSYDAQRHGDASSFVIPVNALDKDTWADNQVISREEEEEQRSILNMKMRDKLKDEDWWTAVGKGFFTQWAAMHPQQCHAFFYAHSLHDVIALAPLIAHFHSSSPHIKAFLVISGGSFCPCREAARLLHWPPSHCLVRRFKIFDLQLHRTSTTIDPSSSLAHDSWLLHQVGASMNGLLRAHNPALVVAVMHTHRSVLDALSLSTFRHSSTTSLAVLPRNAIPHSLWIANVPIVALRRWKTMRISINVITQNRAHSLQRLFNSLSDAYYLGDEIQLSINMDSKVDTRTVDFVQNFEWPHGQKLIRRRIIQGGLIRAVSESWYPTTDDDFGLLLEDDIEVSPFYYMWLKYTLLMYHYNPQVSLPELNAVALYSPRLVEVVTKRPKWNATDFFKEIHPNTPYLHQLPCSWGSLFFPKHWREFYIYMGTRYTDEFAIANTVHIPRSTTNGWQASWKKFLIDMMYLRGYVTLYPNFPNQTSFSTNHMEPGVHIGAQGNAVKHAKEDFEVPLLLEDFRELLPQGKLPPAFRLPVIDLFNQRTTLENLKAQGAKLSQDVLSCRSNEIVVVDHSTGAPLHCATFSRSI